MTHELSAGREENVGNVRFDGEFLSSGALPLG
jgi:hypothetical protein